MELEERKALARQVLATLDGYQPETVRLLASTLTLTGWQLLGTPFDAWADVLEGPEGDAWYAELTLAFALRKIANQPSTDLLIERLEGEVEPPWAALRDALVAVREARPGQLDRT